MLRDGLYSRADELEVGQSLMPLYVKNGSYEQILNNKTGRWNFTHIYVYKWFNEDYDRLKVIHHYDVNPKNNEPNNLKQLTRSEHMRVHKDILCKLSVESRRNNEEFMNEFGGSYNAVKRRVAKINGVYNHKVKDIEIIYLDEPEPVYDITVDETSNFALTNGIFVHNSKDLADAVCGAANNALESTEIEDIQRENDINYFLDDYANMSEDVFYTDRDNFMRSFEESLRYNSRN